MIIIIAETIMITRKGLELNEGEYRIKPENGVNFMDRIGLMCQVLILPAL